eukprot:m.12618 g.12618  ORF g.12618 m.12618 type:complete len:162 (+) comp7271_c0_seq1:126-611(+)
MVWGKITKKLSSTRIRIDNLSSNNNSSDNGTSSSSKFSSPSSVTNSTNASPMNDSKTSISSADLHDLNGSFTSASNTSLTSSSPSSMVCLLDCLYFPPPSTVFLKPLLEHVNLFFTNWFIHFNSFLLDLGVSEFQFVQSPKELRHILMSESDFDFNSLIID